MVHFISYIFSLASGASRFMLVIYDLYCQSKLLIKIQLYVIQQGIEFFLFSLSVESYIHNNYILVIIKYAVIGPSSTIITCHSNLFLMVRGGDRKYLPARTVTSEDAGLQEHRRLPFSLRGRDTFRHFHSTIITDSSDLENLAFPHKLVPHMSVSTMQSKEGFPKWGTCTSGD